jgi:protein-S-isoprenylcysteine O-methyltransferase Ste14
MASWSAIARRVRVPLGFAFAVLYLWLAKPTLESILIGAGLVIPGLVVRALASGHLHKNEQLATGGPYAYTRNPLYLGSLILSVGFALASRSWWIVVGIVLLFFAIYRPVIRAEEAFLRERFPQFDEYAREVPRLLPRVRRFGKPSGSFSWDLYWKHREYNATLGSAAIIVALLAKLLMKW